MKLDPYHKPYKKKLTQWIKDLNLRTKTVKLVERNIGENLNDIGFGSDFLDMTLKAEATKEKINKLDVITVKILLYMKENCQESKKKSQNGRKYMHMQITHMMKD